MWSVFLVSIEWCGLTKIHILLIFLNQLFTLISWLRHKVMIKIPKVDRICSLCDYLLNDVSFMYSSRRIDLDYPYIHPDLLDYWLIFWSFLMTMTFVMFACCTIGSVARNLIIINTRAQIYACTNTDTHVCSILSVSRSLFEHSRIRSSTRMSLFVYASHLRTFHHDNDDSQGDDQFSFLSNLAFCRQWLLLLSVSLLSSRDSLSTSFHFSQRLLLNIDFFNLCFVSDYWNLLKLLYQIDIVCLCFSSLSFQLTGSARLIQRKVNGDRTWTIMFFLSYSSRIIIEFIEPLMCMNILLESVSVHWNWITPCWVWVKL